MASANTNRVHKTHATLRARGLRPVQIWVPDTRRPGFAEEYARQCQRVAELDKHNPDVQAWLDAAEAEVATWDDWKA